MPHSTSTQVGPCVICGKETDLRCSKCAAHGTDWMRFCGSNCQTSFWWIHRKFCGPRSNPFTFPGFSEKERDAIIELSTKPAILGGNPSATTFLESFMSFYGIKTLAKGKIEFRKHVDDFLESSSIPNSPYHQKALIHLRKNVGLFRRGALIFAKGNASLDSEEQYQMYRANLVDCLVERIARFDVPELLIPGSFPFQSELYHLCLVSLSNTFWIFREVEREERSSRGWMASPIYGIQQFNRFLVEKVKPGNPSVYRKIIANSPQGLRTKFENDPFHTGNLADMKSFMIKLKYGDQSEVLGEEWMNELTARIDGK